MSVARLPWTQPATETRFQSAVRDMLELVGEDPDRDGLLKTPERVERAMRWLTRGYDLDAAEVIGDALFEETHQNMIVVRDIEFYSMCEHHMLPFFGKAHVAYIPNGRIVGLSKVARVVDVFARRLQVQERLTDQIAEALDDALAPRGRGRGPRGVALLHDDAGGGEAELPDAHQRAARRVPGGRQHAGRVPAAGAAVGRAQNIFTCTVSLPGLA